MTAAVPSIIVDLGILAGVFTALMTALAVAWKTPPVRWFRAKLSESLGAWFEERVESANEAHHEYVRYHLGPNGTTKPIHRRLQTLESAMGDVRGEQEQVRDDLAHKSEPFVDWHQPYEDDGTH